MRKILYVLLICILIFLLASCKETVPEYKDLGRNPQMGDMIEVNGIIYRTLPNTEWRPLWIGLKLVALNKEGDRDSNVYMFTEETRQIFVMQQYSDDDFISDMNFRENYYYREDVTLPPYDRSGIDMLGIEKEGLYSNYVFTQNKALIDQVFILKNKAYKPTKWGFDFVYDLQLMNSNYPGIGIDASIYQKEQKYWIVFNVEDIVAVIPQDILEQIVGEKLPPPSE